MKLIRCIKYDIDQGLFCFWKRYILIIFVTAVSCIEANRLMEYFLKLYHRELSPIEYGIQSFLGRYPYRYNPNILDSFELPYAWLAIYLMLAVCIGNYLREDLNGFGVMILTKCKQRYLWWISKCIWCVLVNIMYFALLWGVNISYSWILGGTIKFQVHKEVIRACYGNEFAALTSYQFILIIMVIPLLVGIAQSMLQMVCLLFLNGNVTLIIMCGILVLSSYYANEWLIHGYSMCIRYFPDGLDIFYQPLNYRFGLIYLGIAIIFLMLIGYIGFRKKDILAKNRF